MSRILRKQLFSVADLLEKANKVLEKKLFTPVVDEQAVVELVTDCQDGAISMGEQIEKMYGEGMASVELLEQYCETLYLLTISIQDTGKKRELYHTLSKQLKKLRGIMNSEISDKLEVVFFPYKASMWDSLESIYLAAKADENFETYCVPIPYYDRNADGSFRQMHYEGEEFPEYVQIVNYMEYDVKTRRPDIIYIHNPYDSYNYVTSIAPEFYSDELKKYTDCLVYVPYFIVDDTRDIKKISTYAVTPAVINADYVFVQSEAVREKYIEAILSVIGDSPENRKIFEKKIYGTGSPKYDAVKYEKPDIRTLPQEWQNIIGDGRKKIIFYNTHLSMLMPDTYERFLVKLRNVLDYFKARNDVILLWRPHPLTIETVSSMNPVALSPYLEIVERYKKEGWGIYDDSADMERAIALSDAYYGSDSSIVPLYRQTGKPVLLHSPNVPTEVV